MAESAIFVWEGKDKQGRKTKGEITSTTPAIAKAELRRQGIVAEKVKKKSAGLKLGGGGKVKPADVALFTRQMSTMISGKIPDVAVMRPLPPTIRQGKRVSSLPVSM